jgi:putative ABC transport system permease protein
MKILVYLKLAINSLIANKLRSVLTMLGVIIGVSAVITMISVGRGAEATISSSFDFMGPNVIFIQPSNPDSPGGMMAAAYTKLSLTYDDAEAMRDIPGITTVSAVSENFVEIIAGDESYTTVIEGSDQNWVPLYGFTLTEGSNLTERHVLGHDSVVVLGSETALQLFDRTYDIVGQEVKIKNKRFTVIGVMAPKGGAMLGFSMDALVVVPITTYQDRLFSQRTARGEVAVQAIAFEPVSPDIRADVIAEVEAVLRHRHSLKGDDSNDFSFITPEQMLEQMQMITGVFTLFMSAIAAISLLVASIGIMNIMLVSVTERTREIGVRMAVGAKRRDIQLQFLLEAGILSLVGGLVGIIIGGLQSWGISLIDIGAGETLEIAFSWTLMLGVMSISFIIGLVSGIYPAIRASRLNPIDALRYG